MIPIVNANDSVSIGEIESGDHVFGDNDMLSSVVAVLCQAGKLVILSDIEGIYDCDPRKNPHALPLQEVADIDENILSYVATKGSARGAGGVRTKLQAALYATEHGTSTVITRGNHPESLYRIIRGEKAGTLFVGKVSQLNVR